MGYLELSLAKNSQVFLYFFPFISATLGLLESCWLRGWQREWSITTWKAQTSISLDRSVLSHPGGPSRRCPAWKMHTHLCSFLLAKITYSNAAPGSLMLRVKRRAFAWIILLRYTPPDGKEHKWTFSSHVKLLELLEILLFLFQVNFLVCIFTCSILQRTIVAWQSVP